MAAIDSEWTDWVETTTWAPPIAPVVQFWDGLTLVDAVSVQFWDGEALTTVDIEAEE